MAKIKNHITINDNYGFGEFEGKEIEIDIQKDSLNAFPFPSKKNDDIKNIKFISFKNTSGVENRLEKYLKQNQSIVDIYKKTDEGSVKYYAKTGNFIGVIYDKENNLKVEITSRFGNQFLEHMLNYLNNIFLPDISYNSINKKTKNSSQYQFILAHLFIQSLEKAATIFGFPKTYQAQEHNGYSVKGKLDIRHLISHNIPLRSHLRSQYRAQVEVQDIINVLYATLRVLDNKFKHLINAKVLSIKNALREKKTANIVSSFTIKNVQTHKALLHPNYQSFTRVLQYAEMILKNYDILEDEKGITKTKAYLLDVSELFEIYIEKLLRHNLQGWSVKAQEKIDTYEGTFFAREIRPDLVLEKDDKVLVFDTKYKRMNYRGSTKNDMGDVDRTDFFQIHTYMAHYFDESKNTKLVAGGLLYPIEGIYKEVKTDKWLGNTGNFIIDGINLNGLTDSNFKDEISARENKFVNSIKTILT